MRFLSFIMSDFRWGCGVAVFYCTYLYLGGGDWGYFGGGDDVRSDVVFFDDCFAILLLKAVTGYGEVVVKPFVFAFSFGLKQVAAKVMVVFYLPLDAMAVFFA